MHGGIFVRRIFVVFISLVLFLPASLNLVYAQENFHAQIKNCPDNNFVIGFLPLDTRPCTYDFPIELAQIYGAKIIYPPRDILANFRDEPDIEIVHSWLAQICDKCDALVVSMEQLVYGGLIQARDAKINTNDQDKALNLLRDIKKNHPDMPIYISNVLMRTSTSAFDAESLKWWQKISDYSTAYYRSMTSKNTDAKLELSKLENEIPKKVLDTFWRVRKLNHELNLKCIELISDGIADYLQICQEDSTAEGVQRFEQKKLMETIFKNGCADKISMANGTDEAGSEILMRVLCPHGSDAKIVWLGENTNFTAKYEDRPFVENLNAHMKALNIKNAPDSQNVICILPPKKEQCEYAMNSFEGYQAYTDDEIDNMAQIIYEFIAQGKHVFLLDVESANGGNPILLISLAKKFPILNLYGYSAWNTASNSLGTLLAQLLAGNGENSVANQNFTAERIIDDCVYQSTVRKIVKDRLESFGVNTMNLAYENGISQMISGAFKQNEKLLQNIFAGAVSKFEVSLRWPRLFEISIRLDD